MRTIKIGHGNKFRIKGSTKVESIFRSVVFLALVMLAFGGVIAQNSGPTELVAARRNLMPVPSSIAWREGGLPITKSFTVAFTGQTDERLRKYVFRVLRRLDGRT